MRVVLGVGGGGLGCGQRAAGPVLGVPAPRSASARMCDQQPLSLQRTSIENGTTLLRAECGGGAGQ